MMGQGRRKFENRNLFPEVDSEEEKRDMLLCKQDGEVVIAGFSKIGMCLHAFGENL